MKRIDWQVEGMTCSNCALTIQKFLIRKGMQEILVNPIDGKVQFNAPDTEPLDKIRAGIAELGYRVVGENGAALPPRNGFGQTHASRFYATLPFTLLLMVHMLPHDWVPHTLTDPRVQLALCLPVFLLGMYYFGRSALKSLLGGVPNMNVLIALGALTSFVYSLVGLFVLHDPRYLFFETTASIITLVFLGHHIEELTLRSTQKALRALIQVRRTQAHMIAFDDNHQEQVFDVDNEQLRTGDLILIRSGEQVPADCRILWGEATVDESLLTGESLPLSRSRKELLIGGSTLVSGTIKAQVTAAGTETVLSGIIRMVEAAQSEKPPMQKLADRISAVFVPLVVALSVITYMANLWLLDAGPVESVMRAVAVLVISCPCAMGLATPAAISVGMGRAARNGILFRNASSLEHFKNIRRVVFDKTGTLTTGSFRIGRYHSSMDDTRFRTIVASMELHSAHPIARCIVNEWGRAGQLKWKQLEEIKGRGIRATDEQGVVYELGTETFHPSEAKASPGHSVYLFLNGNLQGWVDVEDEIRPEAKAVLDALHRNRIETVLLTGDQPHKAEWVAEQLGISTVFSRQTPEDKLNRIRTLNQETPTAMVGDGINDAPALAASSLGISLSDASQLALQHADVILLGRGLSQLPEAMGLGKHTYLTIRQNLFWAFAYNIVAIPVAFGGWLTPSFSAMAMGFSDLVLVLISLRLYVKPVQ